MGIQYTPEGAGRLAMTGTGPFTSPSAVGRRFLGAATVVTALLGLGGDHRWLAASGAFGLLWWAWDLVWDNVCAPLGAMLVGALTGAATVDDAPSLTTDDTIRLLEDHLASDETPRHVQIQSALRLAELYRFTRHDPAKAEEVMRRIRDRYPGAPELGEQAPELREQVPELGKQPPRRGDAGTAGDAGDEVPRGSRT
jgi:hypothetical protein